MMIHLHHLSQQKPHRTMGGGNTNDNSITTENNESETETPTETDNNSPDGLTVAGLRNILSNPIPLAMPPLPEEELQIKNSINNNTNLNFEKRLDVRPANSGVNEVQLNGKEIKIPNNSASTASWQGANPANPIVEQ